MEKRLKSWAVETGPCSMRKMDNTSKFSGKKKIVWADWQKEWIRIADGVLQDSEEWGRINCPAYLEDVLSAGEGTVLWQGTVVSSTANLLAFKALFFTAGVKNSFYWGFCDLYRKHFTTKIIW